MKYKITDLDKRFCDIDARDIGTCTLREFIMEGAGEFDDPKRIAEKLKIMSDSELTELIELYDYLREK